MSEQAMLIDVPAHDGNADENQRYTIRRAREWCMAVAHVTNYDLDAAACEVAHHAPVFYDGKARGSGLIRPWFGDTFVNPPWDDIHPWVLKAWRSWSYEAAKARDAEGLPTLISISMLLPGGRTHRPWWKELVEPYRDGNQRFIDVGLVEHHASLRSINPPERFPYGGPGNPEGVGVAEPNFTSVLLVWRRAVPKRARKLQLVDVVEGEP